MNLYTVFKILYTHCTGLTSWEIQTISIVDWTRTRNELHIDNMLTMFILFAFFKEWLSQSCYNNLDLTPNTRSSELGMRIIQIIIHVHYADKRNRYMFLTIIWTRIFSKVHWKFNMLSWIIELSTKKYNIIRKISHKVVHGDM